MEQVIFTGSLKNIPQAGREEYTMKMTNSVRRLLTPMTWTAAFVLGILQPGRNKETYGFNSLAKPPHVPELEPLKNRLAEELVGGLKYKKNTNNLQHQLRDDISMMDKSNELFIAGDKSNNYYKVSHKEYSKHLKRDITKVYEIDKRNDFDKVTKEDKRIAEELEIADRVFKTSQRQAFLSYKDHKENFNNSKPSRLINPCKPELGKVSKNILEKIRDFILEKTKLLQFKNNISVIQWFNKIPNKQNCYFIQFDICDFYPSINKKLLSDAIEWAQTFTPINRQHREIIFHVRKTFLFNEGKAWVKKKDRGFDVAQGSYDSAEVTDLVGLYLLHQLKDLNLEAIGLYRDDGLALSRLSAFETNKMKDAIAKIFGKNGLKVTIHSSLKVVDFLDVTLDLMTGLHKPYCKPNTKPLYVHAKSNHPSSIIKNIPANINKRLSILSSNEEVFKSCTKIHQEALKTSGYDYKLKFEKQDLDTLNNNKKRKRRQRRIYWFNPPWDMNVATKIGKKFFQILDETIPPGHPLHKVFNRKTVKLSYSTMPNMLKKISVHNSRVTAKALAETSDVTLAADDQNTAFPALPDEVQHLEAHPCDDCEEECGGLIVDTVDNGSDATPANDDGRQQEESDDCNCNGRMGPCPLDGDCRKEKSCIYSCKVTRLDTMESETYTGLTAGTFKRRYYGHNSSFNNRDSRQTTLSRHCWTLTDNNIQHNRQWTILAHAKAYNPVTKVCRLCLKEVYYILYKPETASLNSKSEVFGWCKHRHRWTLSKA